MTEDKAKSLISSGLTVVLLAISLVAIVFVPYYTTASFLWLLDGFPVKSDEPKVLVWGLGAIIILVCALLYLLGHYLFTSVNNSIRNKL